MIIGNITCIIRALLELLLKSLLFMYWTKNSYYQAILHVVCTKNLNLNTTPIKLILWKKLTDTFKNIGLKKKLRNFYKKIKINDFLKIKHFPIKMSLANFFFFSFRANLSSKPFGLIHGVPFWAFSLSSLANWLYTNHLNILGANILTFRKFISLNDILLDRCI